MNKEIEHERFLVTGASGFLGWNICRYFLSRGGEVLGIWKSRSPDPEAASRYIQADLTTATLPALLASTKPSTVIHCAAVASRAACDADHRFARSVNTDVPERLAAACAEQGCRFVHISTDLVFDGCNPPYREAAMRNPLSVYGESKSEAEDAVLRAFADSIIIRTALMYGMGPFCTPGSFLQWTLDSLREAVPMNLYTNQFRTILYAPDVPRLIDAILTTNSGPGLYHAAGPERLSRYEAGFRIAKEFGYTGDSIVPAVLPRSEGLSPDDDVSLDTAWTTARTGIHFTAPDDALAEIRRLLS